MVPWWAQMIACLTAVGGLTGVGLRFIHRSNPRAHNRATCKCNDCAFIRRVTKLRQEARDMQRRVDEKYGPPALVSKARVSNPPASHPTWRMTTQLEDGMVVSIGDGETQYLVRRPVQLGAHVYHVNLENIATRQLFEVDVPKAFGAHKMWRLHGGFHGRKPWDNGEETPPWLRNR